MKKVVKKSVKKYDAGGNTGNPKTGSVGQMAKPIKTAIDVKNAVAKPTGSTPTKPLNSLNSKKKGGAVKRKK